MYVDPEGCLICVKCQDESESNGRLDDEGYSGSFQNGMWKFYKGSLVVARANVAADSNGDACQVVQLLIHNGCHNFNYKYPLFIAFSLTSS
mgnify:CR=1 FL=1